MTPFEAVTLMQYAMSDLIERHCNDRARDDYYDDHERFRGMEEILTTGPAICDKDRHALEMWVLSTEHLRMVTYHATEIGDDTEPLPPIFAEVESMLKPKTPVRLDWDLDLDLDRPKATTSEAVSEWAQAAGSDPHRLGKKWLVTDYDTVVWNPHYTDVSARGSKMTMRTIQGREIVSDLLGDGVDQWEQSSTQNSNDWQYIDILRAERAFANSIILRLTDDNEATANLIATVLVRSACAAFASLTVNWNDEMLADVPAIVSGLAKAEAWLVMDDDADEEAAE